MVRSSGTLDPFLRVVDGDRFVVAENDDEHSETRNARINNLIIERGGAYIVMATRYDDSSGSFVLSIEEAAQSGSGSTRQAPLPIGYGETRTSTLSHEQYERFYTFQASADDVITIDMIRGGSGDLDSYMTLTDSAFKTGGLKTDDSGEGQNARIIDYRIPADGKYHIVATRYDGGAGSTARRISLEPEPA